MEHSPNRPSTVLAEPASGAGSRTSGDPCERWRDDSALLQDLGAALRAAAGPVPPEVLAASRALLAATTRP